MSCVMKCARWILCVLSVLFMLVGAAAIGLCSWILVSGKNGYDISPLDQIVFIVIVCLGSAVFVVGFFGCCGALNETGCLLKTFTTLNTLVIIGEFGLILLVVFLRSYIDEYEEKSWMAIGDKIRIHAQKTLECCAFSQPPSSLEISFKSYEDPSCFSNSTRRPNDCHTLIDNWLRANAANLIVGGSLLFAFQLMGVIYGCLTVAWVNNHRDTVSLRKGRRRSTLAARASWSNRIVPVELSQMSNREYRQREVIQNGYATNDIDIEEYDNDSTYSGNSYNSN